MSDVSKYNNGLNFLDLFAGAGGLSEGFVTAGFIPVAHVESDQAACYTLRTRTTYHWLKSEGKEVCYARYLNGKITRRELYKLIPEEYLRLVINAEIGKKQLPAIFKTIDELLGKRKLYIIIGGPPCQAYSVVGRSRDKNKMRGDKRNYLYIYYAEFLKRYKPYYFIFENDKTKASGLTARLKRIISKENGPYVIIFWTKHKEVIELVVDNCKQSGLPPVAWVDIEKTELLEQDGTYNIEIIKAKIKEKLNSIGAFMLYVAWENAVNLAAKKFVSEFAALVEFTDSEAWSQNTSALFHELYKAYSDNTESFSDDEKFRYAGHLINRSFLDQLENLTSSQLHLPDGFALTGRRIDKTTIAKLNASLFLHSNKTNRPCPGHVYTDDNTSISKALIKNFFKDGKKPDNCKLCKIIITPECDLAYGKTLRLKNKQGAIFQYHRIVHGLLCQIDPDKLKDERKKFHDKGKDARFIIGPLWSDNHIYWLVIHFFTISLRAESEFNMDNFLFAIKRNLLFDLQSKSANHVNRLGNFQLD
jgi:hypothetical protein